MSARRVSPRWVRSLLISSALVLLGVYLLSGVCVVKPEEQALVTRFGKLRALPLLPGTHYRLPYPVDQVTFYRPNQVKSRTVGAAPGAAPANSPAWTFEQHVEDGELDSGALLGNSPGREFLTGDENIIHISLNVQYKIENAPHYLFNSPDTDVLVEKATESALADIVARTHVDELLTSGKQFVLSRAKTQAQETLNSLGAGIMLISANFAGVAPPAAVADAFKDVASALEDRDRLVNEAQGDYNEAIPRARGEADRQIQEALAARNSKVNRARGDTDRFKAILDEYRQTGKSETSLIRLYIETLEEVLPQVRKYVIDASS